MTDEQWNAAIAEINSLRYQLTNSAGIPYAERTKLFHHLCSSIENLANLLHKENEDVPH